ncbi:CU044_5270 family protein OS=Streptomyces aurantiogriseus OX=66870 GN=GCM10010251_66640 PE=4 SV=1 [Streptomyces aurantiogriseus]
MNSTPAGPEQEEREEREELARLLPVVPVEQRLSPGRHSHHKDVLMQLIDRDRERRAESTRSLPRPRRFSRPALVAASVAVAVAATLTVGVGAGRHGGGTAARPGASSTGGATHSAVVTLDRIASVALRSDVEAVKESQFVYVRSKVAENEGAFEGPVKLGEPHERQVWFSQDPEPTIDIGLIREYGQDWPIEVGVEDGTDPADAGIPAGIERRTYAWLASLPTDPGELLKLLYKETPHTWDDGDRGRLDSRDRSEDRPPRPP